MNRSNLYNRIELPKIEIRYMFLQRSASGKSSLTNIGILTTDMKYIEYEMQINQKVITGFVAQRIRQLFCPYKFTRRTAVIISDSCKEDEPLYMYLRFVRPHIQFNLSVVSVERIVGRILSQHGSIAPKKNKNRIKYLLNKTWNWLVEHRNCYWISKDYDYKIQNLSTYKMREKKILRLGMYYMLVKEQRMEYNYRTQENKQIELDNQIESQENNNSQD